MGEFGVPAGLITLRSQVQILPPPLGPVRNPGLTGETDSGALRHGRKEALPGRIANALPRAAPARGKVKTGLITRADRGYPSVEAPRRPWPKAGPIPV